MGFFFLLFKKKTDPEILSHLTEVKDALMRWRMATAQPQMTDLMITMRVAIILIKWNES